MSDIFGWLGFGAMGVGALVVACLVVIASRADDELLGDRQYEESPPAPELTCAWCGKPGLRMAVVYAESRGKLVVHRGGCPHEG
jgi:hypothetical protein